MTFTESDAENDGKIKREAGQQLNSVMAREGGELYTMFRQWCEDTGRDPSIVLGDMVLRAIKDESFAGELSGVIVDIGKLNMQETKKEDLEFVVELIDEFGGGDSGKQDPIDRLIEKRIEAIGSGPMGAVGMQEAGNMIGQNGQNNGEVQSLREEVERLKGELREEKRSSSHSHDESPTDDAKSSEDVDELFDRGETDDGEVEVEEEDESEETVDVSIDIPSPSDNDGDGEENAFSTEGAEIDDE